MINKLLGLSLSLFVFTLLVTTITANAKDTPSPVQVVTTIQKLPSYELLCRDENRSSAVPIKIGIQFQSLLSTELYKLFMWSQCVEPELPPHYVNIHAIYWDIRFSLGDALSGVESAKVENIRVRPAKFNGTDKAVVKVLFDVKTRNVKNIITTYTLINEDGQWKIDDIAPQGDIPEDSDQEPFLIDRSDSIKIDMQNNYNAAMERYKQEQAKTGAATKP